MAKDWEALQAKFLIEHEQTGITAKDWCVLQGLRYETARRYIKVRKPDAKTQAKVNSSVAVKNQKAAKKANPKAAKTEVATTNRKRGGQFGNQNARIHGGYSKYFKDESIGELVQATNLDDELSLCRSRLHQIIATIETLQDHYEKAGSPETAAAVADSILKAEIVLDKNIARIESIERTISSISVDELRKKHIVADTERVEKTAILAGVNSVKGKVQTELFELQVEQQRKEMGGTSKLDSFIDELTGASDSVDVVVSE